MDVVPRIYTVSIALCTTLHSSAWHRMLFGVTELTPFHEILMRSLIQQPM